MYQEIRTSELFGSGLIGRRIKGFDRKKIIIASVNWKCKLSRESNIYICLKTHNRHKNAYSYVRLFLAKQYEYRILIVCVLIHSFI